MNKRRVIVGSLLIVSIIGYIWLQFDIIPSSVQRGEPYTVTTYDSYTMSTWETTTPVIEMIDALPFEEEPRSVQVDQQQSTVTVHYEVNRTNEIDRALLIQSLLLFYHIEPLQQIEYTYISNAKWTIRRPYLEEQIGTTLQEANTQNMIRQLLQDDAYAERFLDVMRKDEL